MRRTVSCLRVVLVAVLLTGCAASTGARTVTGEEVEVEVRNDLQPRRPVTIRAISSSGARTSLGVLSPGQTRLLWYRQPAFHGAYRLIAEADGGGQVVSIPIVLTPGMELIWTLQSNVLRESSGAGT